MTRSCDVCGTSYEAKRPSSRYCGGVCRKRAQRNGVSSSLAAVPTIEPPAGGGRLTAATRSELSALGVLDSALAEAALALALQVDALPDPRTMPGLTREWRATMAEARAASVAVSVSPLDELRRRREQRSG